MVSNSHIGATTIELEAELHRRDARQNPDQIDAMLKEAGIGGAT